MKVMNLLRQALYPRRFGVMLKKLFRRMGDPPGLLSARENLEWIKSNCSSFSIVADQLDSDLWQESLRISNEMESHANAVLSKIDHKLGGGAVYPFLYFLTRYLKPTHVVETGVAAGYSSYAFLAAMKMNGGGTLYSSDFPYFRLPDPEKLIGIVVPNALKSNWKLFIEGDETNLRKIRNLVEQVHLFHYDSDKSYAGRRFAMEILEGWLSQDGIILMDDIQDNSFFHDYAMIKNSLPWRIFEYHGKYVGMIGTLLNRTSSSGRKTD